MSYRAAIDYLFGLQKHGIKLGLDKTREVLSLVGNPHKQLRCVHVAGTNGKGSVSAMIASVLRAHGFRVGLFTSPHLVSFTERIRVDEREITESEVADLTDEIRGKIDKTDKELNPTFFEVVTAIAFVYFVRQGVDWVVIETGMGGRLDATNVIAPDVSVITSISYDHREFLGESLSEIAGEKAGIIKEGIPVVSAPQLPEAAEVIANAAREKAAQLFVYGEDFTGTIESSGMEGTRFNYSDGSVRMEGLFTPLAGEYQVMNAALAIKAVSVALKSSEAINSEVIKTGLAATRWRGRLELVSAHPPIIVDGAHNAAAAAALAGFIKKYLAGRKIILVLGIMADKEIGNILNALLPVVTETIFTSPAYSRAESPHRLVNLARLAGFKNVRGTSTVRDAIAEAKECQASHSDGNPAVIIITGSFYTAGEALESLGEKSILSTLRETL
jgi:dihydrofolate synthase/folylpolyglutamate synthase